MNTTNGDLGRDGRIILDWILKEVAYENMAWIHLVQDTVQWRVILSTTVNLQVL
jgi:predicted small integral membrane protein